MKSVLILGAYPPPYGGISVHIGRLALAASAHFRVAVFDFYSESTGRVTLSPSLQVIYSGRRSRFRRLLDAGREIAAMRPDIVHFHASSLDNLALMGPMLPVVSSLYSASILTVHSGSLALDYSKMGKLKQALFRLFIRQMDHIITVNEEQKEFIEEEVRGSEASVIPAFLTPTIVSDPGLKQLVEALHAKERTILLSSGYGVPLYGFHHIAAALEGEGSIKPNVHLIIAIYNKRDEAYLESLKRSLQGIEHTFVYDLEPSAFNYLLSQVDVYIRATDRDGDAVAIREALHVGKRVVASNCVIRPEGCNLFDLTSPASLSAAIKSVLSTDAEPRGGATEPDFLNRIFSLYERT